MLALFVSKPNSLAFCPSVLAVALVALSPAVPAAPSALRHTHDLEQLHFRPPIPATLVGPGSPRLSRPIDSPLAVIYLQTARMSRRAAPSAARTRGAPNDTPLVTFEPALDSEHAANLATLRRHWKWAAFSQFFYTFAPLFAMPEVALTVSAVFFLALRAVFARVGTSRLLILRSRTSKTTLRGAPRSICPESCTGCCMSSHRTGNSRMPPFLLFPPCGVADDVAGWITGRPSCEDSISVGILN